MKGTNKTFRFTLPMIFMALLIAGSLGLGAYALFRTKLDVGGNISFTGTGDILATISNGTVAYGSGADTTIANKMTGFSIVAGYSEEANVTTLNSWKDLDLDFSDAGGATIKFSITNNSSVKNLQVGMTSSFTSSSNMTMTVSAQATGIDPITPATTIVIGSGKTFNYSIKFAVTDPLQAAYVHGFTVRFNMVNTTAAATSNAVNVTYVVDGGTPQIATVPAGEQIGGHFPEGLTEENTCGFYRNPNYTDLVESTDVLDADTTLYTARATDSLVFTALTGGGVQRICQCN